MTYQEKVDYLIKLEKQFEGREMYGEIKRRYDITKGEVYDFEQEVFNILFNYIMNEKNQIDFLNNQKEQHKSAEMFKVYLDNEITKHQENIKLYGEQVYSLYSRETIIGVFEKRIEACKKRIDYWNYQMEINANEELAGMNLRRENNYLKELNNALTILNGTMLEMLNSYLSVLEIGHRL